MKATDTFKSIIKAYLDERATVDELFAKAYEKTTKTLDECINYIFNEVQKSGCNGFADDEIYSMAVHYYDEDSIHHVPKMQCKVIVNKRDRKRNVKNEIKKKENNPEPQIKELSLFDF